MKKNCLRLWLTCLLGALPWGAAAAGAGEPPSGYARIEHQGVVYHTLRVPPERVQMRWRTAGSREILRTMKNVRRALAAEGIAPVMIMNGGIYEPGGVPTGLYVEAGRTLRPANLNSAKGNFFLKPNGIFAIVDGKAVVQESTHFMGSEARPTYALQSGPLLLLNGKVHPAFRAESVNYLHRNGVGVVAATGEVLFAITEWSQPRFPNLHQFAMFFAAQGCENALFLDGDISQAHIPGAVESNSDSELGAYIVIVPARE